MAIPISSLRLRVVGDVFGKSARLRRYIRMYLRVSSSPPTLLIRIARWTGNTFISDWFAIRISTKLYRRNREAEVARARKKKRRNILIYNGTRLFVAKWMHGRSIRGLQRGKLWNEKRKATLSAAKRQDGDQWGSAITSRWHPLGFCLASSRRTYAYMTHTHTYAGHIYLLVALVLSILDT